jgi:pantetheine-phosphate adenylyltransferase
MPVRAVFPATFDPIHYGHIDIAFRANRLFDELIIGVYDRPLKSLLFSPEERIKLVKEAFIEQPQIRIMGYQGLTVDFCRRVGAQVIVRGLRVFSDFEYEFRLALANYRLALITNEKHTFLSSSTVREIASLGGDVSSMVPQFVENALRARFQELGESQQVVPTTSLRD